MFHHWARALAAGFLIGLGGGAAQAQDWKPKGPVRMLVAFRAGGGADTLGRLLAEELAARRGWVIVPENLTGKGGATMATALKKEPADGLSIGVAVTGTFDYNIRALRDPGYMRDDFDYLSTLTGSQMAIIAKADRGWRTLADVIAAAKSGEKITFGAMSQKLADGTHVLGRANGVDFATVMLKGGKAGLNGVIADDLDLAWAAGVQTANVLSGDVVNLVSAEETPLRVSPDAPQLAEYGVPFTFGTKFIVVAPAGLPEATKAAYEEAIREILQDPDSSLALFAAKAFSGPEVVQGAALRALIDAGFDAAGALLEASGE